MKRKFNQVVFAVFCLAFLWVVSSVAMAQEAQEAQNAVPQDEVAEQIRISEPGAVNTTTEMIDEWKTETLRQLNLQEGVTEDGKFVVFASANVSLKDTDPQYGDALVNAFDVAMMEAQQRMLMDRFGRLVTSECRETFRDQSTNNREIPLELPAQGNDVGDKSLRVMDKMLSVTEAKLDEELEKHGVPRAEYVNQPVEKKKVLFRNALVKETMKKASGDIAGLFPIQTTVKKDAKGNTKVGVILIMSQKSVQVAKDIRLQRRSLVTGKGANLHEKMLPRTDNQWQGQLGTRLVYDFDGSPVIVSYGMGSYVPDGDDDYINEELREEARKQAMNNADAQIAAVVAGQMSAEQQSMQGELIERALKREMTVDSSTLEQTTKEIIKQSSSYAKSKASMDMKGIATMGSKNIKLPSGQYVFYVVRYWTYTGLDAVNNLNNAMNNSSRVPADSNKGTGAAHEADGFIVNDVDDF